MNDMTVTIAINVLKKLVLEGTTIPSTELSEAIDTVLKEVESKKYTAEDMEAFAEWSSKCKWFYDDDGKWYQEEAKWIDNEPVGFSTTQLRELWEQGRRAK